MKAIPTLTHLSVPALLTVALIVVRFGRESFDAPEFIAFTFISFLFYAAPHLWWLAISKLFACSNALLHAGFVAASLALAAICSVWFFPPDPSGLPLQWMLYWPLAIALQVILGVVIRSLLPKDPR